MAQQSNVRLALMAGLLAFGTSAVAQDAGERTPKGRREQPKKVVVTDAETHLDDVQKAALKDAKKMMGKVYGYKGDIPDEAKDHFQRTIWTILDGTHQPERGKTNKFANFLVDVLTKESLTLDYSVRLLSKIAELVSNPHEAIPQEDIDNFVVEARGILGSSQLTTQRQQDELKAIEAMLTKNIKYNEEKVKQREADEKRKADAKEKAEQEKAEKKAKAKKSGQRGGRTGGTGGAGGRGGRGGGS